MWEISLYLLLGNLITAFGSDCLPVECLTCGVTGETRADPCELCPNNTALPNTTRCIHNASNCKRVFKVSINSTGSDVKEGDNITLTCDHNLPSPNVTFEWMENNKLLEGKNKNQLILENVLSHVKGPFTCTVRGACGNYMSSPHYVTVKNESVVILVICGVCALVLVVVMGLAMKFKLKRDNAKHRERMRQKAQAGQIGGPAALTPRGS